MIDPPYLLSLREVASSGIVLLSNCQDPDIRNLIQRFSRLVDVNLKLSWVDSLASLTEGGYTSAKIIIADMSDPAEKTVFFELRECQALSEREILILCPNIEASEWQEAVVRREISDYLITQPLYDPGRLRLQIRHAAERTALRQCIGAVNEDSGGATDSLQDKWPAATPSWFACFPRLVAHASKTPDFGSLLKSVHSTMEESKRERKSAEPRETGVFVGRQALVIEDNLLSASLLRDFLTVEGFMVVCVTSIEQACEAHGTKLFDVFFVDLDLPGASGPDGIRTLKARMKHKGGPVIVTTAHTEEALVRECVQAGAKDYLAKPITYDKLMPRVAKAMGVPWPVESLE